MKEQFAFNRPVQSKSLHQLKPSQHLVRTLLFLLLVGGGFLSGLVGCGNQPATPAAAPTSSTQDVFARIKKEKVLRVGYIVAPPWIIRDDKTGALSGTSVDTINEIARVMGAKVEFTEATFATFTAGLQTHKFDLSIAPTFSTIPRALSVAFTNPQMYVGNSAIIKKGDTRFKTLQDIDKKGVTVAVTQGEQGDEYAKTNFKKATIKVLSVGDQSLTFTEVLSGRADVALGDAWFTAKFTANHPQVRDLFADNPYNLTPVAWAVRQEDLQWLNFINTCLDELDSSGKLADLDRKYEAHWLRPKKIWQSS